MENLLSTNKSVSQLIEEFDSGDIAVPEIQRDVVWTSDKIKQLIDSISQGFPCGSLILWEPREKDHALVRSIVRPERLDQNNGQLPRYFLLDGQQRVTALASVMLSKDRLKKLLTEVVEELAFIFVNLRRFPRALEATTDVAGYRFPWVLFNRLFDGSLQKEPEFSKLAPKETERISRYVQKFRDYQFPIQIIRDRDYATVGEIFTRVNSQGTPLTGAEIHLARIVPYWKGITKEFRDYRRDLRQQHYDLDLTFLMRALTVIECEHPRIKKLAERISKDKPSRAHLNKTWQRARGATDKLIRILKRDLLLDKSKYFVSKNALVPLIYYLSKDSSKRPATRLVQQFFLLSQLSEHYGAGAETALAKDFRILDVDKGTVRQGLQVLVTDIGRETRQYYRGLKIQPSAISGVPSKNVLVLLMYIVMVKQRATDWGCGTIRPLDRIEPENMQLHHIFPFNFMVQNRTAFKPYEEKGWSPWDFRADLNDIANLTFLSLARNAEIKDSPPWQYLPDETTREMRKAHCIPEDPLLWRPENYMKFLDERRKLLARGMNRLLKSIS
jgi:hypothetical protein